MGYGSAPFTEQAWNSELGENKAEFATFEIT